MPRSSLGLSTQLSLTLGTFGSHEVEIRCLPQLYSTSCFETPSLAGTEIQQFGCTVPPAGPASSCSCLPRAAGIPDVQLSPASYLFLFGEFGDWTQALMLVQEAFHPPSCPPRILFYLRVFSICFVRDGFQRFLVVYNCVPSEAYRCI